MALGVNPNPRWVGSSQRLALFLILGLAGVVSSSMVGITVQDGFHPLALLVSLLPLQLAALLRAFSRRA
jgi:hypothetical protein